MRRKSKYNIDAEWNDPFERQSERRVSERCPERFVIKVGVKVAGREALLAGSGLVQNISQSGMLCRTKHQLIVGQEVHLSIRTEGYSVGNNFPLKFIGTAQVARLTALDGAVVDAALVFGSELSEDMSFSIFIEALQSIALLKSTLQ